MILKKIYLVFRHFVPTFIGIFLAGIFLIYFQIETFPAIISFLILGSIQPFIDKYREVGRQLSQENATKTVNSDEDQVITSNDSNKIRQGHRLPKIPAQSTNHSFTLGLSGVLGSILKVLFYLGIVSVVISIIVYLYLNILVRFR